MQFFLITALFAATGLAASFTCPGGLIGGSPACCSANVLGILSLECKTPDADGCKENLKPTCCTLVAAGQGVLCNPQNL